MKSYAIYDEALNRKVPIGYLLYYEKSQSFIVELCEDLDEWEAPLLFQKLVREKQYTVPRDIALMWVKERIIPSGRQNIGSILKYHHLREYSEIAMLNLSKGRCAQDLCYVKEIAESEIPKRIKNRINQNLWECFPTKNNHLVCMFRDDLVKKVDLALFSRQYKELVHVLRHPQLLECVKVGPGGYSVIFDEHIELPASALREFAVEIPLTATDFYRFASRNIIDATKTCDMLQCSRQNLAYMVKSKKLKPVVSGTKEKLYVKGEVERAGSD